MKVQVTIEMSDNARLGVGLAETGNLVPASRKEAQSYITELVNADLAKVESVIVKGTEALIKTATAIDSALHGE